MSKKRLTYLDMAKGIGIFLVVLGHIEYIQETTRKWIFSFHMPLFFVVGGILSYVKKEEALLPGLLLRRKARGTLVPYASFSAILLTMSVIERLIDPETLSAAALQRQFLDVFTGYGIHILWFLPAYFLANAVFALLNRKLRSWQRNLMIGIAALLALSLSRVLGLDQYTAMAGSLLWHAGMNLFITLLRGLLALPFVLLGWYLGQLGEKAEQDRSGLWMKTGILFLLPGAFLALRGSVFDLHYLYVRPLHYAAAACSCTGVLSLCRTLSGKDNPVNRVLSCLGRNSLLIMCTHASFFVVYYVSLGMFFLKKFVPMTQPMFNLGVAVLVCAAEIPITWIFNRYFKHLLGRTV